MSLGFGEIVLILVIVLIVFGAKRLPEIGKALGTGVREFKKEVKNLKDDDEEPRASPAKKRLNKK